MTLTSIDDNFPVTREFIIIPSSLLFNLFCEYKIATKTFSFTLKNVVEMKHLHLKAAFIYKKKKSITLEKHPINFNRDHQAL